MNKNYCTVTYMVLHKRSFLWIVRMVRGKGFFIVIVVPEVMPGEDIVSAVIMVQRLGVRCTCGCMISPRIESAVCKSSL